MTMFWKDRRVFVTGGTGFLGAHVVRMLCDAGAQVTCLVKEMLTSGCFYADGIYRQVDSVHGTIDDLDLLYEILRERRIDTVFHLAAQPIVIDAKEDPLSTFQTNVRGTYLLLEAARKYKKLRALVAITSDKVYHAEIDRPYVETDRLGDAGGIYEASKVCADVMLQSYAKTYGLPIGIMRAGNFYGPGDIQWSRIIPGTIRLLLVGKKPIVRSDGTPVRDYFYVEDGAEALLCLGEALDRKEIQGQVFNFGTGKGTKVVDVIQMLIRRSGKEVEPVIQNVAQGEIAIQTLNCDKAKRMLDWHYKTSLKEGLEKTWIWYEKLLRQDRKANEC